MNKSKSTEQDSGCDTRQSERDKKRFEGIRKEIAHVQGEGEQEHLAALAAASDKTQRILAKQEEGNNPSGRKMQEVRYKG